MAQRILYPDCAFELLTPRRRHYNFVVELDSGTERIRPDKETESWERKIRLYDELQSRTSPKRFRVLIVTTRSAQRLRNILGAAGELVRNRQRSIFYGVYLPDYMVEPDAVCKPCLRDHRSWRVSLIPSKYLSAQSHSSMQRA